MTDQTVKEMNERLEEEAREAARAHYINSRFVGVWSPSPDLASWAERYRKAFEDELARLERERLREGL